MLKLYQAASRTQRREPVKFCRIQGASFRHSRPVRWLGRKDRHSPSIQVRFVCAVKAASGGMVKRSDPKNQWSLDHAKLQWKLFLNVGTRQERRWRCEIAPAQHFSVLPGTGLSSVRAKHKGRKGPKGRTRRKTGAESDRFAGAEHGLT